MSVVGEIDMRIARSILLAGVAVATLVPFIPTDAEARGGRGLGSAIAVGRSVDRAIKNGKNGEAKNDGLPSPEVAGDEKADGQDAGADAKASASAPMVAAAEPLVANSLVCIAGCYDTLGRPVRR